MSRPWQSKQIPTVTSDSSAGIVLTIIAGCCAALGVYLDLVLTSAFQ